MSNICRLQGDVPSILEELILSQLNKTKYVDEGNFYCMCSSRTMRDTLLFALQVLVFLEAVTSQEVPLEVFREVSLESLLGVSLESLLEVSLVLVASLEASQAMEVFLHTSATLGTEGTRCVITCNHKFLYHKAFFK